MWNMYPEHEEGLSQSHAHNKVRLKESFLRWEVQFFTFIGLLFAVGLTSRIWQPLSWILNVLAMAPFLIGIVGFLSLAALVPMPYPKELSVLFVRLRQLFKGIWAAMMLVLGALLGTMISADFIRYGTNNFQGFLKDVFVPGYLSLVLSLVLLGGGVIYMMLTAMDLLRAGEPARAAARRRVLHHLVHRFGWDNPSQWPYSIRVVESVWKNLTGGRAQLILFGYLTPLFLSGLIYTFVWYTVA